MFSDASNTRGLEVFLYGGLGNQLFGWATGLSVSKKIGKQLILNISSLSTRELSLPKTVMDSTRVLNKLSFYDKLKSPVTKKVFRGLTRNINYFERSFHYEDRITFLSSPRSLRGFFQSYRYFEEDWDLIEKLLKDDVNLTTSYSDLRARLPSHFTAVHVRRGDYLNHLQFHGIVGDRYYEMALNQLDSGEINLPRVIFTDDKSVARSLFPDCLIVGKEELTSPFETLILMSEGQAIVGANSTFSLWAGFLLKNKEGTRIFPRQWFVDKERDTSTLMPSHFKRV